MNLFVTCLGDTFYPDAVGATVRVLERLGFKMTSPAGQTCCGQPLFNAGYFDQAKGVARHFLDVFSKTTGPIITPYSSCAGMVRDHYPRLFEDEPEERERALAVGARTFEFTEFLVKHLDVDLAALGARFEESVTFHYSCHFRAIEIRDEPVALIRQIDGIDYLPLENMEQCCGFGGSFSIHFPHLSGKMAAEKVEAIRKTGARWLVFSDAGCAMNITGTARRNGTPIRAMHLAELIDRALGGGT